MSDEPTELPGLRPITLSTDAWNVADRFDAWRDEFALRIAHVDVSTPDKRAFSADIHVLPLPNLTISKTTVAPCNLTRTPSLLRDGDDGLVFILCLDGTADIRFGEDRARLRPGTGTLVSNHRLGGFFSTAEATTCSIRIDRDVARSFAPSLDQVLVRESRPEDPSLLILQSYLQPLLRADELSSSMMNLADNQIRELLAHIINPTGDLARSGAYGGIKAARLQAVQRDIALRIADPRLGAAALAHRLGLSERYVHLLFEGAGFTFSSYVRELRLDRARQMLRDPLMAQKRIIDICELAGFSDLSYFNRVFRARFGQTPSDARRSQGAGS
jgi:AraC-like DNA-binding protein